MKRVAAALLAASPAFASAAPTAQERGLAFWKALVEDCAVPPGQSAAALVGEAVSLLGSPDPQWRDDVGYGLVASCVYQKRALSKEDRRRVVAELLNNLQIGIDGGGKGAARSSIAAGSAGSVLLRSFSALDLSVFAALENEDPALDESGYRRLLEGAFAYLQDERDLRGIDPRLGWIHATAHTADLLKLLARNPRFTRADQGRLLDAVATKLITLGTPVFTHAEDERLAAAIVSLVQRDDFDAALLEPWLARFVTLEKQVWSQAPPDPQLLDAAQNGRSLLRSLYVQLSLPPAPGAPATPATAAQTAAHERVLATLSTIRR